MKTKDLSPDGSPQGHDIWTINAALALDVDVFRSEGSRKGLSAGPHEQLWFHEAVLAATSSYADPRLVPMRAGVRRELDQFAGLAGLPPKRV